MKPRLLISWSSGKDSAWMLHLLQRLSEYEICGLVTTINAEFERVAMHGVRRTLVEEQARAAHLPLWDVLLPWPCDNETYETRMRNLMSKAVAAGIEWMAFGDLFLEDIRVYRERLLDGSGVAPLFPLWHSPTDALAREMIRAGVRAHVVCVDPKQLDRSFAGRAFDDAMLRDLPSHVDPCGENGEFHTFVSGGPMFDRTIGVTIGEALERDGFVFADVQLA